MYCFKCFCSKDLLPILDFILIYFWTQNYSAVISVKLLLQFLQLLHFHTVLYMNTKLRFQVGPGPLISPVHQGPRGLKQALAHTHTQTERQTDRLGQRETDRERQRLTAARSQIDMVLASPPTISVRPSCSSFTERM